MHLDVLCICSCNDGVVGLASALAAGAFRVVRREAGHVGVGSKRLLPQRAAERPERITRTVPLSYSSGLHPQTGFCLLRSFTPLYALEAMSSSSRRASSSSDDSGRSSPIQAFDSSTALILVPDNDDPSTSTPFSISSDDDYDSEEDNDGVDRIQASAFAPLSSISVFLYLLSPFLKLGAILLPNVGLPLEVVLPALLFFAALTLFTRQIWYMLARYVRRADLEEIVLETFARDRRKEGRRSALRQLVRLLSGVFRVLMAAMYIRGEHHVEIPKISHYIKPCGLWFAGCYMVCHAVHSVTAWSGVTFQRVDPRPLQSVITVRIVMMHRAVWEA